jgi:hypothetical protein
MRSRSLPHIVMLMAALAAPAASAADFTFHVPVTIRNAPGMTSLQVSCVVRGTLPGAGLITILASGNSPWITVPAGNYSGTVTVAVNALNATYASSASLYSCNLGGQISGMGPASYGSIRSYYQLGTGQTLTESVVSAEGPIAH